MRNERKPTGSGRSPDLHKMPKRNPKFHDGYHFVTIITNHRFPLFKEKTISQLSVNTLHFYQNRGDFELIGYVIMPDHIHFICSPSKNISEIIRDIKKYLAKGIIKNLLLHHKNVLNKLKMPKPGKRKHNYQIWQPDFYDFNILSDRKLNEKLNYMYANPARKGLCESIVEYKFSDAGRYFGSGDPKLPVD